MIRPFTCLCMLLAGGSGLYLYQEKHRTQLLDREIGRVIHETEATRALTSGLKAEWQVRNEPGRLADLAGRFLALKPVAPGQFVQLAELGTRLPAVGPMPADPATATPPAPADAAVADAGAPAVTATLAASTTTPDDAAAEVADAASAPTAAAIPAMSHLKPAARTAQLAAPAHPRHADHQPGDRPIEMQLARNVDAGHATSAYSHGGMLPLAAPRSLNANVMQAMARPMGQSHGYGGQAMARTLQPTTASYVRSSLGGGTALPPPTPYTGE